MAMTAVGTLKPSGRKVSRAPGISGSLRQSSFSTAILRTMQTMQVTESMMALRPLHEIPLYNQDIDRSPALSSVATLRREIAASDGVVVSTSEYNHGIPGVLKNALDLALRPAFDSCFRDKPVLILSSATGHLGGVRAQYQLRETLTSMLAQVVPLREIVITDVGSRILEGRVVDASTLAHLEAGLHALLHEIELRKKLA
jgi:chromate reductase